MGLGVVEELGALTEKDLAGMDRREEFAALIEMRDGRLRTVASTGSIPGWDAAKRAEIVSRVARVRATGGRAWGVRVDGALVGLASVDATPVGGDPDVVALDLLHVSAPWRGRGLARALVETAAGFAVSAGARALYVSATCTARTVAVYRHLGAVLADPPDPDWLAREPVDIHLVIPLPLSRA